MKFGMIATWVMARYAIETGCGMLEKGQDAADAIETAIKMVEDYPYYKSVGYGGLPNERGEVELDGAFMDGKTLSVGAVAGVKRVKNPISVARELSQYRFNNILVGTGAEEYAFAHGFEPTDMLTDRAKQHYEKRLKDMKEKNLSAYDGHDTVGMVALDETGHMCAGTSTSGLFMKKPGRVGDSPFIGSGFYVDEKVGGCVATGVGEDIMKGCLSYEVVRKMKEGLSPMEAASQAVEAFNQELIERRGKAGAISVVCLNNQGEFGVGTNIDFSFAVGTDQLEPTVYTARMENGKTVYEVASEAFLDAYYRRIKAPIE